MIYLLMNISFIFLDRVAEVFEHDLRRGQHDHTQR